GGTLLNESISTAAGASHGHFLRPSEMRALIRGAGRLPAERSTIYRTLREFPAEPEEPEPLDAIGSEDHFGSYASLVSSNQVRFVKIALPAHGGSPEAPVSNSMRRRDATVRE